MGRALALIARVEKLRRLQAQAHARTKSDTPRTDVARFAAYRHDPVGFAREVLGLDLWERQIEFIETAAGHSRVACRSGHKCGKSTAVVALALWFVCTRSERARVIMTAPGDRQVKKILWKELRRIAIPRLAQLGSPTIGLDPATGMRWPDGRECIGFSTKGAENIAGFSSPEMLWLIDEASGYPQDLFEAIEGNRAGGDEDIGAEARLVLISNPTQSSGEFYDAFHTKREFYAIVHISSEETPNVTGKGPPIRGLATRAYVELKRREWGEEDDRYQVRVRGNFPRATANAVIGFGLVEAGLARWRDEKDHLEENDAPLVIGVDVARFGDDDSAFAPRRGRFVYPIETVHGYDTVAVAAAVYALAARLRRPHEKFVTVNIEANGVGAGVVDNLRVREKEPDSWLRVVEVNVSSRADDEDAHYNLRSQLWFGIRAFLEGGGSLPSDAILEGELLAPLYSFDPRGRQRVESKDDIKAKIQRSPDKGDALGLACYNAPRGNYALATAGAARMPTAPRQGSGRGF